jgi:hypothetical protein
LRKSFNSSDPADSAKITLSKQNEEYWAAAPGTQWASSIKTTLDIGEWEMPSIEYAVNNTWNLIDLGPSSYDVTL